MSNEMIYNGNKSYDVQVMTHSMLMNQLRTDWQDILTRTKGE